MEGIKEASFAKKSLSKTERLNLLDEINDNEYELGIMYCISVWGRGHISEDRKGLPVKIRGKEYDIQQIGEKFDLLSQRFESKNLENNIKVLKDNDIKVSLFVDAAEEQIIASKDIQADIVEIHAGEFCRKIENSHNFEDDLERIKKASQLADNLGLEVHIGHGITFDSIVELAKIPEVKEFNIGHFIIAEAIFSGLGETVSKLKVLIKENRGS